MSIEGRLPRYPLAFLPTPLHPLPRLSARLGGPEIWIKRDDQTGLAGGGNKTRKLEFLVGDALSRGADTLITTGAVQSNHCRQTAAATRRAGLRCELVLGGEPPAISNGNLLLDELFGATLHWTVREHRMPRLVTLEADLRAAGGRPYLVPYGGSNPIGATGYVLAAEELLEQATELGVRFDALIVPSSSGGTQAGASAGVRLLGWEVTVLGISIDEKTGDLRASVATLATETAAHVGRDERFSPEDILVNDEFLGGGYGVVGDLEREAIRLLAETEGILLDPVYTGRAFGGMVELIRRGVYRKGQTLLFWHTGGAPALFAYARELSGKR